MLKVFDGNAEGLSFHLVEPGYGIEHIDGLLILAFDEQEFRRLAEVESEKANEEEPQSE